MIAGMDHQWAATIEGLAELDRSQAFAALDVALKILPSHVPDGHRAVVAHWRGKCHYLLSAALVSKQQWLDARTCLERAVQLLPGLAIARLKTVMVWLALAEPQPALALLAPLSDSPFGLLRAQRAQRAQANVLAPSDLGVAAASAAAALGLNSRLPEALLLEWLQLTGGLLLAGHLSDARAWLLALTTIAPSVAATANACSRLWPSCVCCICLLGKVLNKRKY